MKTLRWVVFLPLALAASIVLGAPISAFAGFLGSRSWYVWLVSGALSAWAFFFVAFRVAPTSSPLVKWSSVAIVGVLGLMAALGPLMTGNNRISALAGAVMVTVAVYYARLPMDAIRSDVDATFSQH